MRSSRPLRSAIRPPYFGTANLERARINFGDGQVDRNIPATPAGNGFEFVDSHTYAAPGTYTVTVMIASPGSRRPNDNTVTTRVTVATPTSTPTPTPTPTLPPSIGPFRSSGLSERARVNRTFQSPVARFSDPRTTAGQFSAVIDFGDQSEPTPGQIRRQGNGRYVVVGSHRYSTPGVFQVTVTIRDAAGAEIAAHGLVNVRR
jgi:hypothetical protein